MAAVDTVFEQLGSMTVLELVELKKKIEDEWGITAAAPVAVATAPRRRRRPRSTSSSRTPAVRRSR
jgi:large subunit ribosomal protein L7/L12